VGSWTSSRSVFPPRPALVSSCLLLFPFSSRRRSHRAATLGSPVGYTTVDAQSQPPSRAIPPEQRVRRRILYAFFSRFRFLIGSLGRTRNVPCAWQNPTPYQWGRVPNILNQSLGPLFSTPCRAGPFPCSPNFDRDASTQQDPSLPDDRVFYFPKSRDRLPAS